MKQTAGSLKLELAQFRELAAFSQFASDLDAATRAQLERGQRLMEVIKQGVHEPLSVPSQIAIIFAGTNGFLDDIPVDQVRAYEAHLIESLDSTHAEWGKRLMDVKVLNDDLRAELEGFLPDVKRTFSTA
jgi:F-type H+-transporting ATPase subunit alpha